MVPVEVGLGPVETSDGSFALASVSDVSEQKREHDELVRSNAELEQFAYVASHDLREPLRMVISYTERISQRYSHLLDERGLKYANYAVDGARRMSTLIDDLLTFSRAGKHRDAEPVAVVEVLREVKQNLSEALKESGGHIEWGELPDEVLANHSSLAQVFQNLIGNALKFRADDRQPRVSVRASFVEPQHWQFAIEDNGIGIEPEHAEKVFQMFQRLHARTERPGSGIGLAVIKRIVEAAGGRVWFESIAGEGTTFFFTVRAVPKPE